MANQICTLILLLFAIGLFGQSKKVALASLQVKKDSLLNIIMLETDQASWEKEKKWIILIWIIHLIAGLPF